MTPVHFTSRHVAGAKARDLRFFGVMTRNYRQFKSRMTVLGRVQLALSRLLFQRQTPIWILPAAETAIRKFSPIRSLPEAISDVVWGLSGDPRGANLESRGDVSKTT